MTLSLPSHTPAAAPTRPLEWPTIALGIGCAFAWGATLWGVADVSVTLAVLLLVPILVLHSSLSHEALHGHPFANQRVNDALAMMQPGVFVPYLRFRDTHRAHHKDAQLTDPYDDPESNYLDPAVWARLWIGWRLILRLNNTLLGRMLIGPIVSQIAFMRSDARLIWAGHRGVLAAWVWHVLLLAPLFYAVTLSAMPFWAYLLAAYGALCVLKIRTFLEHRAHEKSRGRTVIIEDRGPLAFLFLNNSLHAVHHMHPQLPWYDLPARYRAGRARYLACNAHYVYRSYGQIFAQYFLSTKDPVAHPLWPSK